MFIWTQQNITKPESYVYFLDVMFIQYSPI